MENIVHYIDYRISSEEQREAKRVFAKDSKTRSSKSDGNQKLPRPHFAAVGGVLYVRIVCLVYAFHWKVILTHFNRSHN